MNTSLPTSKVVETRESADLRRFGAEGIYEAPALAGQLSRWDSFLRQADRDGSANYDPRWLLVFNEAFGHRPLMLEATDGRGKVQALLPLCRVQSLLFGKHLVSLPYLNHAGLHYAAGQEERAAKLIEMARRLADEWNARYLVLRHEAQFEHSAFNHQLTSKVALRLPLPADSDALWSSFNPKVRNQIRKGEQQGFSMHWGREELLGEFYAVFSHKMRDLGTPVFSRRLFEAILRHFPQGAEFCVVREGRLAIAAALLVHGSKATEVPSAASLTKYNPTNANMLMYWHLLRRAIERGQRQFDFGRSTEGSGTFRFKKQWGAAPEASCWQYYVRRGDPGATRPDSDRNQRLVRLWKRLPLWLARLAGPPIVRGIP